VGGIDNLVQDSLHDQLARRRVYVHPIRWTSLGLSLLEAMYLGMPVVALGTTEVVEAVPPCAGVTSTNVELLVHALADLVQDPDRSREMGLGARDFVSRRYPLEAFLARWDQVIEEVTR
jgi:glycosyltransferase involved in cell wall biosynthesis